ncbi:50S ribosomal protein L25 [bacterium]|nr:50S ribosomal protein L25 [bacterium]
MEGLVLNVEKREKKGKEFARKLRANGKFPAILYGGGREVMLSVDEREFRNLLRLHRGREHMALTLIMEGESIEVFLKDVQHHPVTERILHADFEELVGGRKVTLDIDIEFEGVPEGVKEGGLFEPLRRSLRISCLPRDIPESLKIDVSKIKRGEAIKVKELSFENIEILEPPDEVIALVSEPRGKAAKEAVPSGEEEGVSEETEE